MRTIAKTCGWLLLVGLAGCRRCGDDPDCDDPGECIAAEGSTTTAADADASGGDDGSTTQDPAGSSGEGVTDPSTSTGAAPGQCQGNDDCAEGEFCVAPYADNVRGPFDCVSECVGPMDEAVWCYDDDACCDPQAHCTIRGYCEVDETATTTDGESTDTGTGAMTDESSSTDSTG